MDFEKAMARLSEISELMSGELPLEQSVKLYTEAVELTKQCREYINAAKLTVEQLEAAE
ncbi:MAG: exodeoxyribonuclease VII small subunit [Ruminococcaceae bacterium]|nr:exodeoxyribonuclease VII small subunit [Oscillospiraceae bacterium]